MSCPDCPERKLRMNDVIPIFKNPETEEGIAGFGRIIEILEEDDEYYSLMIIFLGDTHGRKVQRKYRKRPAKQP